MEGPGEAEEEWWAPSGLLWRQGLRYFMVWGCPWNGVIQESCWKAALWYVQWGVVPEGTLDGDFCLRKGHFPSIWKWKEGLLLRLFSKSSTGFSQYLSWRVWELWHHLCGIFGFSCILVLCNQLDTKFNRDSASYTPQVTKCGGQLIMFSLGGRSVPEMMTPLFSLNSNWKYVLGLPRWLSDKRICLPMQEMQEKWVQFLSWEDFLEEQIATQSSILARIIPWTEEPGGLQSVESQRVGHD